MDWKEEYIVQEILDSFVAVPQMFEVFTFLVST